MALWQYWADLYSRRLNWAFEAQHQFMNQFHDREVRNLNHTTHRDILVAVFGPSQVGKTTLILRLIGVDPAQEQQVADELRGSRPKGRSSTVTAMLYAASPDDRYYLRYGSEAPPVPCKDGAELGLRLDELRAQVESEPAFSVYPVEIYIPRRYFKQESQSEFHVRVVDLPGINSATREEHVHVNRVIQHYMPQANLILLVNQANQIASLGRFEVDAVKHWRFLPQKFRIILTFAVSNRSVQELLVRQAEPGAFQAYFKDEFAQTLDHFPRDKIGIYPLEYGDSWRELLRRHPEPARCEAMMDSLFEEMRSDIRRSANIYSQIRMNYQMAGAVGQRVDETEEAFLERSALLDVRAEQLKHRVDRLTKELLPARRNRLSLAEEIGAAVAAVGQEPKMGQAEPCKDGGRSVDRLKWTVRRAHAEVCNGANKAIEQYEADIMETGTAPLPPIERLRESDLERVTGPLLIRLTEYWVDWYVRDSQWEKDLSEANKVIAELNSKAQGRATSIVKAHWQTVQAANQQEIERARRGCARAEALIARQQCLLADHERQREKHQQALEQFQERARQDIEHAGRFQRFVDSAFAREYQAERRRLNEPGLPAEQRWLHLCYVGMLLREYDKLREVGA